MTTANISADYPFESNYIEVLGSKMLNADASPPADILLKDGDKIAFGTDSVEVIHTPGHTRGGICLYWPGYVVTGDTLFVGGVGRTDLPGGSYEVLQASIRNRLFTLPDDTVVLSGHANGATATSTIAYWATKK